MTFELDRDVQVKRDEHGAVRRLQHPRRPYQPTAESLGFAAEELTPRQLADDYLQEVLPVYALDLELSADTGSTLSLAAPTAERPALQFESQKETGNQAVVSYVQTEEGIPVWRSGVAVKMVGPPYRVIASHSTATPALDLEIPAEDAAYLPERIDTPALARLLRLDADEGPTIHQARLLVYPFDPEDRGNGVGRQEPTDETQAHVELPTLDPPPVSGELEPGRHYVVTEVLFTLAVEGWGDVNWAAFIEPATGSVLRLESFVGCLHGMVYRHDPVSRTGDTSIRPSSPAVLLDAQRERVQLEGLSAPAPANAAQELRGEFVHVRDVVSPNIAPPTSAGGADFDFSVPTDDFAAVNAYYHCDRLFRLLRDLGFDVATYFDGTSFPVRVDHRCAFDGDPNSVNAQAPGNVFRTGSDGFRFAMLDHGSTVGMAAEWRVVLHEFGHAILWDHLHWPNFRFAHSPGDSLAAILSDPDSLVPDRFDTFPWTPIRRRHDRRVEDGWGWGGRFDDPLHVGHPSSGDRAGYRREQILSSSLFRLYRSLGGDHTDPGVRRQAARYSAYLVLSAVANLSNVAPPQTAEDFADELINADFATVELDGFPGGASHKVVRWAFEQQGAYPHAGTPSPVVDPGAPPEVDVYLDDGRGGGYQPLDHFAFTSQEVWNRRTGDDGTDHQSPVSGQRNFLYARVRNRGTDAAEDVSVAFFGTTDTGERPWPAAWSPLGTAQGAGGPLASGGEVLVGPVEWTPQSDGTITILASASADGDSSNADTLTAVAVAAARLAHTDNNVAGRPMTVLAEAPPDLGADVVRAEVQPRLAIPDADSTGVVSLLAVTRQGRVASISAAVTIVHTFRGDLRVTLTSPQGTAVDLFEGDFTDGADNLIATFTAAEVPALDDLRDENPQGTWQLRVVDRLGFDKGTLERWSLEIKLA